MQLSLVSLSLPLFFLESQAFPGVGQGLGRSGGSCIGGILRLSPAATTSRRCQGR